jgi:hypothetical protein
MQDSNFKFSEAIRRWQRLYADGSPRRSLHIRRLFSAAEGGRRRIRDAMTAPARPRPAGLRVPHVRRQPLYADGHPRRIWVYGEGIQTPMVFLVEWPGAPPTPTAPTFGRRRRCRLSAPFAIPVVTSTSATLSSKQDL